MTFKLLILFFFMEDILELDNLKSWVTNFCILHSCSCLLFHSLSLFLGYWVLLAFLLFSFENWGLCQLLVFTMGIASSLQRIGTTNLLDFSFLWHEPHLNSRIANKPLSIAFTPSSRNPLPLSSSLSSGPSVLMMHCFCSFSIDGVYT